MLQKKCRANWKTTVFDNEQVTSGYWDRAQKGQKNIDIEIAFIKWS